VSINVLIYIYHTQIYIHIYNVWSGIRTYYSYVLHTRSVRMCCMRSSTTNIHMNVENFVMFLRDCVCNILIVMCYNRNLISEWFRVWHDSCNKSCCRCHLTLALHEECHVGTTCACMYTYMYTYIYIYICTYIYICIYTYEYLHNKDRYMHRCIDTWDKQVIYVARANIHYVHIHKKVCRYR